MGRVCSLLISGTQLFSRDLKEKKRPSCRCKERPCLCLSPWSTLTRKATLHNAWKWPTMQGDITRCVQWCDIKMFLMDVLLIGHVRPFKQELPLLSRCIDVCILTWGTGMYFSDALFLNLPQLHVVIYFPSSNPAPLSLAWTSCIQLWAAVSLSLACHSKRCEWMRTDMEFHQNNLNPMKGVFC